MTIYYLDFSPSCFWTEVSLNSKLFLGFLSGLKEIFHWYAKPCMTVRSLWTIEAKVITRLTKENNEVSSARSLASYASPCGKSLI